MKLTEFNELVAQHDKLYHQYQESQQKLRNAGVALIREAQHHNAHPAAQKIADTPGDKRLRNVFSKLVKSHRPEPHSPSILEDDADSNQEN